MRLQTTAKWVVIGCCLSTAGFAAGDDYPFRGLLYNTKEMSSLVYECHMGRDERLSCKFMQTRVRKKLKPEEVPNKIAEFDNLPDSEKMPTAKDCEEIPKMLEDFERRRKSGELAKSVHPKDLENALSQMHSYQKACETGDMQFIRSAMLASLEQDTRTCLVSSHSFEQTFRRVSDDVWVVDDRPDGPCGVVELSRFEPDNQADTKLTFWNYVARKAVTNPKGQLVLDVKCSDLDEETYIYSWRASDAPKWAQCEKIEFSVF